MSPNFRSQPSRGRSAHVAKRQLRSRILVVCGGLRTEKDYLNGLRDEYRSSNVSVRVHTESRSPLHVVKKASELYLRNSDEFDECWAVFDVDDFDIASAVKEAAKSGVRLAVSNPCFEYWLLLHFCDHSTHISTKDSLRALKKNLPAYDKTQIRFQDFVPGVQLATERAKARDSGKITSARPNPSTGVWGIVEQVIFDK